MSFEFFKKIGLVADPDTERRLAKISAMKRTRELTRHVAEIRDSAPAIVKAVEDMLDARGVKRCIHRVSYRVTHKMKPDELLNGSLELLQFPMAAIDAEWDLDKWRKLRAKHGLRAYPLSAEVVTCNCSQLPMDVVATLHLVRDDEDDAKYAECRFERELPMVCVARTHWSADDKVVAASPSNLVRKTLALPLLGDPLDCHMLALNIRFSSVDAIGFDATALMQKVARKFVACDLTTVRYAIPLVYAFTGLLRRVHAACTMADLRRGCSALEVAVEPDTTFELMRNDTHFIIDGKSLDRAIEFIERRLKPANQPFDVGRVYMRIEPFGGHTWLDAWQTSLQTSMATSVTENSRRHRTSAHAAAAASTKSSAPIVIELDIVIYFVMMSPLGIPAKHNYNTFAVAHNPLLDSTSTPTNGAGSSVTASQEHSELYGDLTNGSELMSIEDRRRSTHDDDDDDDDEDEEQEDEERLVARSE